MQNFGLFYLQKKLHCCPRCELNHLQLNNNRITLKSLLLPSAFITADGLVSWLIVLFQICFVVLDVASFTASHSLGWRYELAFLAKCGIHHHPFITVINTSCLREINWKWFPFPSTRMEGLHCTVVATLVGATEMLWNCFQRTQYEHCNVCITV